MEQRDVPCPCDVAICSQSDWIELDRCVLLRSSEVQHHVWGREDCSIEIIMVCLLRS